MPTLLSIAVFFFVATALMGLFSRLWWVFELSTYLLPFYVLGSFVLIFFSWGDFLLCGLSFWAFFVQLAMLFPHTLKDNASNANPDLTLLSINIHLHNRELKSIRELIDELNPDIFVLFEISKEWEQEIKKYKEHYPYVMMNDDYGHRGILVASKLPGKFRLLHWETDNIELILEDQSARILAVHPRAALKPSFVEARNHELECFAEYAEEGDTPTILIGDWNTPPWSPQFRDLKRLAKLKDGRQGFTATWPAQFPWLPFDTALVSKGVNVLRLKAGKKLPAADHKPVLVELQLP